MSEEEGKHEALKAVLDHAVLSGSERAEIEEAIESGYISGSDYQRIYNSHLQTILKHT